MVVAVFVWVQACFRDHWHYLGLRDYLCAEIRDLGGLTCGLQRLTFNTVTAWFSTCPRCCSPTDAVRCRRSLYMPTVHCMYRYAQHVDSSRPHLKKDYLQATHKPSVMSSESVTANDLVASPLSLVNTGPTAIFTQKNNFEPGSAGVNQTISPSESMPVPSFRKLEPFAETLP